MPRLVPALCALFVLALVPASASAAAKKTIYLSLGDSLAASYMPGTDGKGLITKAGYSEALLVKGAKTFKGLRLVKYGCPGEDTTTFTKGGKCTGAAQQARAVRYLKRNRNRIAFVTISIGANNFTKCAPGGAVDISCVATGQTNLEKHLPRILAALRKAGGSKVKFAVLAPYNPFLAFYLGGTEQSYGLAELTISLAQQIRTTINGAAKQQKMVLADGFAAFQTTRFAEFTNLPDGRRVPIAVARICQWTFMCAPAPQGPDIHPNSDGYGQLAGAFAKALRLK